MIKWAVVLLVGFAGLCLAEEDLLNNLRPEHPRLLVSKSTWQELGEHRRRDASLDQFLKRCEMGGRDLFNTPTETYRKEGRRLLAVSRSVLRRVILLSLDYRLTGDQAYLDRAEAEMLAAAAFQDWNPSHYLDTAEMTAALALGYDWLHDALPAESRRIIREAIVGKGLRTGCDPALPNTSWYRAEMNWNQVCFGGLTLGALAVAEDEPDLARKMLAQARAFIPRGLKPYAPDGVYPEGPGYWSYGSTYQVLMIAALESALRTDWGLSESPGFLASASFLVETTGPTGLTFNYSDAGSERMGLEPAAYWMARRLNNPGLLCFQNPILKRLLASAPRRGGDGGVLPLMALWWPDLTRDYAPSLPLAWQGQGANPLAIFRGSWSDTNSLFVAIKGGSASLNHAHMDAGSFILDVDGVRWGRDLGSQDYYSLESKGVKLWGIAQDSERWSVFRLGSLSHSTLTINGQSHWVKGSAKFTAFSDVATNQFAVVDLTPVFERQASEVRRGLRLLPHRAVLVQDELAGLKPGDEVRWAMVTKAKVDPRGRQAILRLAGKELRAVILEAGDAQFEIVSAECLNEPINAPNPDTRLLVVRARAPASGQLRLGVVLQSASEPVVTAELAPLQSWAKFPTH